MITKAQWDAMTAQQQWDMAQSLIAEVEAIEAAKYDAPDDDKGRPKPGANASHNTTEVTP